MGKSLVACENTANISDIGAMALNIKPLSVVESNEIEAEEEKREFLYTRNEAIQLIKSGNQIFGTHGASLTWGIDGEMGDEVTAGGEGEKQVGKLLDAYVAEHPGMRVFHSVAWPGSVGDTDHMLVVGKLILIIDAKRWKGKRKYSVTPKGAILRGTVPFPEGKVKMMPAMQSWRSELGKDVKIMGVVCIAQQEVFVPYDKNWLSAPYRLVTAEKLHEYLDRLIPQSKPAAMKTSGTTLLTIAEKTIKARDRRREIIKLHLMDR